MAGGLGVEGFALNSVEILELNDRDYSPLFDRWIILPEMKQERAWYPSLGLINNKLYVAGGKVSKRIVLAPLDAAAQTHGRANATFAQDLKVAENGSAKGGKDGSEALSLSLFFARQMCVGMLVAFLAECTT